jgi:type II secretory pathway pseudopilin PulG
MSEPLKTSRLRARGRGAGFTLTELLVLILIFLLLLSIFIPFIRKTRESDHRVRCQSNLRTIGAALQNYSKMNQGEFPRVVHDVVNMPAGYFAYTGPFSTNPFAGDGRVSANDVTASLFLLVRGGFATPDMFVCPSTSDYPDALAGAGGNAAGPMSRSNFRGARNLSYSYADPFSAAPGYRFNANFLPGDFVVVADMNPGKGGGSDVTAPAVNAPPLELAKANSKNHGGAGQGVLFADIHVEWRQTPYTGVGYYATKDVGDNIYTVMAERALPEKPDPVMTVKGLVGPQYGPAWKGDTYLVPTEDEDRGR